MVSEPCILHTCFELIISLTVLPFRHVHLNAETPEAMKAKKGDPVWKFARGVDQRNAGLKWVRENKLPGPGVVYFMDDDNTYNPRVSTFL